VRRCLPGYDVTTEFAGGVSVPIGRPLANMRCYILDPKLQCVPTGVPGELMVSGIQLARGYLKRPDLTAASFITNPFSDGDPNHSRLYRTGMLPGPRQMRQRCTAVRRKAERAAAFAGDLARWLPSGVIDFMGRLDYQARSSIPALVAAVHVHSGCLSGFHACGRCHAIGFLFLGLKTVCWAHTRSSCAASGWSWARSRTRCPRSPASSWRWLLCSRTPQARSAWRHT